MPNIRGIAIFDRLDQGLPEEVGAQVFVWRKREIENYYRVGELGQTDPRLETAKQKAKRKYGRYEQKEQRRHHRQWLQSFRKMRRQRDKGYRQITKSMKKEHRRSRGLPDELQAPWKI